VNGTNSHSSSWITISVGQSREFSEEKSGGNQNPQQSYHLVMKTYGADADGPNPYKNPPLVATSFDTTRTGWEFLGEYFSAQFLEQVSFIPFEGGRGSACSSALQRQD